MSRGTGQAALGQSMAGTSRAGVSLLPRVPGQGYQHDRGLPHERVPQDSGRTVTNAQNTTLLHMPRTRQTKGSTSSKSSAFARHGVARAQRATRSRTRHGVERWAQARTRSRGSVFAPSATKMQETRNKMPSANVYLLENLHFPQFFVADSVPGSIVICKRR